MGLASPVHASMTTRFEGKKRRSNSTFVELRRLCLFACNRVVAGKQNENRSRQLAMIASDEWIIFYV